MAASVWEQTCSPRCSVEGRSVAGFVLSVDDEGGGTAGAERLDPDLHGGVVADRVQRLVPGRTSPDLVLHATLSATRLRPNERTNRVGTHALTICMASLFVMMSQTSSWRAGVERLKARISGELTMHHPPKCTRFSSFVMLPSPTTIVPG